MYTYLIDLHVSHLLFCMTAFLILSIDLCFFFPFFPFSDGFVWLRVIKEQLFTVYILWVRKLDDNFSKILSENFGE